MDLLIGCLVPLFSVVNIGWKHYGQTWPIHSLDHSVLLPFIQTTLPPLECFVGLHGFIYRLFSSTFRCGQYWLETLLWSNLTNTFTGPFSTGAFYSDNHGFIYRLFSSTFRCGQFWLETLLWSNYTNTFTGPFSTGAFYSDNFATSRVLCWSP